MSRRILNKIHHPLCSWKLLLAFSGTNALTKESIYTEMEKFQSPTFEEQTDWIRCMVQQNLRLLQEYYIKSSRKEAIKMLLLDYSVLNEIIHKRTKGKVGHYEEAILDLKYLSEENTINMFKNEPTFVHYCCWFKTVVFDTMVKLLNEMKYYGTYKFFQANFDEID